MQRENQQLRKTIDEMKQSSQRIIELEAENEQLQKSNLEGKTTVFNLNEVTIDCGVLVSVSLGRKYMCKLRIQSPLSLPKQSSTENKTKQTKHK